MVPKLLGHATPFLSDSKVSRDVLLKINKSVFFTIPKKIKYKNGINLVIHPLT